MASSNPLKLITDKLDIVFWEENFLANISGSFKKRNLGKIYLKD